MTDGDIRVPVHLAVALDGAGWHPAAWREPDARPAELFTAAVLGRPGHARPSGACSTSSRSRTACACSPTTRSRADDRTDRVRGRLDAVLIAARVAPRTRHIGLVPTVDRHPHRAVPRLQGDRHARLRQLGRAGVRVQVSASRGEAAPLRPPRHARVRRRPRRPDAQRVSELFDEAADYVEVVRRLWDSWEDDAEIRDVATGRFIDRDKLHYIDFEGSWFSVKGPSITPRPPQGQPIVAALAHAEPAVPSSSPRSADVGFVTPHGARRRDRGRRARSRQHAAGRADAGAGIRRPGGVPRRHAERGRGAPAPARRRWPGAEFTSDADGVRRNAGGAGRPAAGLARRRADRLPAAARRAAARPDARSPTGSYPNCNAAGCSARHYGRRHPARRCWASPRPANRYARPDDDRGHHR